jgi:hypothetical protein
VPHVVVMGFDETGRVAYDYWDQATLLVQLGLLDPALLPVSGAEQAERLLDSHAGVQHLVGMESQRRPGSRSTLATSLATRSRETPSKSRVSASSPTM